MALLLSHPRINTFDLIEKDPKVFPVHKAIDFVKKKRNSKLLGIDGKGWQKFSEIISFYDKYSHPSVFAVSTTHSFSVPGARQIGADFDPEKLEGYKKEVHLRMSASERLYDTIETAESHLANSS